MITLINTITVKDSRMFQSIIRLVLAPLVIGLVTLKEPKGLTTPKIYFFNSKTTLISWNPYNKNLGAFSTIIKTCYLDFMLKPVKVMQRL